MIIQAQGGVEASSSTTIKALDKTGATSGYEASDLILVEKTAGNLLPDHEVATFAVTVAAKAAAALDDMTNPALGTGQGPGRNLRLPRPASGELCHHRPRGDKWDAPRRRAIEIKTHLTILAQP